MYQDKMVQTRSATANKRAAPSNKRCAISKRPKPSSVNPCGLFALIQGLIQLIFEYATGNLHEWMRLRRVSTHFQCASESRVAQRSICVDFVPWMPKFFASMQQLIPHLTNLTFSQSYTSHIGRFCFKDVTFSRLQHLQLHRCFDLTDDDISSMPSICSLKTLTITRREEKTNGSSVFTGSGFKHWPSNGNLRSLQINRWNPRNIRHLRALTTLRTLGLWCHQGPITDTDIQQLSKLTALTTLSLIDSKLTGSAARALSSISSLQDLDLSYCDQVTDACMPELSSLKLKRLNVQSTMISTPCIMSNGEAISGTIRRGGHKRYAINGPDASIVHPAVVGMWHP